MAKDVVQSYLTRYATPDARADVWRSITGRWDHFLAVPLCRERTTIPDLCVALDQAIAGRAVLMVFLVNARRDAPAEVLTDNAATLNFLKDRYGAIAPDDGQHVFRGDTGASTALVIDRTSVETLRFDDKEGIGLARRILSDLAVRFHADGKLRHPWVHHTDGDARPAPNHFETLATQNDPDVVAFSHGFVHVPNPRHPETFSALAAYEIWLRHYALGLTWAGSPYGFPTIGSLISCRLDAYAQVRGFPQRMAGEDFYLLNKLAKVGNVRTLTQPVVTLVDRPSDRVPFGTGAGVAKILEKAACGEGPTLYDPGVFTTLKDFFSTLARHFEDFSPAQWRAHWTSLAPCSPEELAKAIAEAWQRGRSAPRAWREFHHWFDGFRTLKYVHALRDSAFPNLPLDEALARTPFLARKGQSLAEHLAVLRAEPLPLDNWKNPAFIR